MTIIDWENSRLSRRLPSLIWSLLERSTEERVEKLSQSRPAKLYKILQHTADPLVQTIESKAS